MPIAIFRIEEGIYDANLILTGNFSALSGYELIKAKLETEEKLPDAFFAASDSLAIGALKAFQEAGLIVPDQIQIISFNDTIMAKQVFLPYLVSLSTLKKWGELPWTSSISKSCPHEKFQLLPCWVRS